jgi:hypothetical protein
LRAGFREIRRLRQELRHRVLCEQSAVGLLALGQQAAKSRFGFRQLPAQVGVLGEFGLRLELRHPPREDLQSSDFLFRVDPILCVVARVATRPFAADSCCDRFGIHRMV